MVVSRLAWFNFCSQNHIEIVIVNNKPLFYSVRDGPFFPVMRVLLRGSLCLCYLTASS